MLTDGRIDEIAGPADYFDRRVFARAIEAEVRAQDTALIQQLVEALEGAERDNHVEGVSAYRAPIIAAARARLQKESP